MRTSGFPRVREISVIPYGLFESDEREADYCERERTEELCEKESVIDGEIFIIPIFIPILVPIIDDRDSSLLLYCITRIRCHKTVSYIIWFILLILLILLTVCLLVCA